MKTLKGLFMRLQERSYLMLVCAFLLGLLLSFLLSPLFSSEFWNRGRRRVAPIVVRIEQKEEQPLETTETEKPDLPTIPETPNEMILPLVRDEEGPDDFEVDGTLFEEFVLDSHDPRNRRWRGQRWWKFGDGLLVFDPSALASFKIELFDGTNEVFVITTISGGDRQKVAEEALERIQAEVE